MITQVLDSAGVEYKYSLSDKDEITLCCPFCVTRGYSADNRYRLGINVQKGAGSCFNCNWKARGIDSIAQKLSRVYGVKLHRLRQTENQVIEKPKPEYELKEFGLPAEYESLNGSIDSIGKQAKEYLTKRGVSLLQIVKHMIGFAAAGDMAWRVLFPVKDSTGAIHGCVGRAFRPEQNPKYLNTPGIKLLWNAHKPSGTAVVVEGVMDALRVETALLQVRNSAPVARLGSTITTGQLDQLKEFDDIIVLPDWDRAGVEGTMELCSRCHSRGMLVRVAIPRRMSGIDPGDMLPDQIVEELRNAVTWNQATSYRMRESMLKLA